VGVNGLAHYICESFSEAIRRLARRGRVVECAGLWADMPEEEFEAVKAGALRARGLLDESVRRLVEAP